jgi:hypothetical protein
MISALVLYERHTGEHQVFTFDDPGAATRWRLWLETCPDYMFTGRNIEIASLSSDSLATIRQTHSRYFYGREADLLSRYT